MSRADFVVSKRALGRIQRLCCLGLGGESIVPDLLREVRGLIPARTGMFRWANSNLELSHIYTENMVHISEIYLKEFHNRRELEVCRNFTQVLKLEEPSPVLNFWEHSLKVDRSVQLRSDHYNIIMRPMEIDEILILRVRENGRTFGALYLMRAPGEPLFSRRDRALLEMIAGFVAHAMTGAVLEEEGFADGDDRGLLFLDDEGKLLYATEGAERLLAMMLVWHQAPAADWNRMRHPTPEIEALCRSLVATAKGEVGQPPPVLRRRTVWGEFVMRAYWVGPTDGSEATDRIGVTIERRVPLALALQRRVEAMDLTGREKQLCVLLGRNPSRDDLAETMGLARHTVITHQRNLYAKLGVHSRAELVAKLRPM